MFGHRQTGGPRWAHRAGGPEWLEADGGGGRGCGGDAMICDDDVAHGRSY
jgi:hypothetical protein